MPEYRSGGGIENTSTTDRVDAQTVTVSGMEMETSDSCGIDIIREHNSMCFDTYLLSQSHRFHEHG